MGRPCTCSHILILTITELLVDNASVPAGGPFIVLLPVGGLFIFSPLVDDVSVTTDGPFIFCSTLLEVTADVSLQVCHRGGQPACCSFFFLCDRRVNLRPFFVHSQLHGVEALRGIW